MLEVTITGSVGSCKLVVTAGKSSVLNVNIATNRRIGDREFTDWTSAKVWGERAEKLAPHVQKGARLLIKGRPEARGYTKSDGTPAAELVVHVNELEFLSAKPKGETGEPEHHEEAAELALDAA
jgi:single-strand DNA-binding protein